METNRNNKIFLFEGPDCVGKTTLIYQLMQQIKGNVCKIHNGVYGSRKLALDAYKLQLSNAKSFDGITLFDRGFLSELIYGAALRNDRSMLAQYDEFQKSFAKARGTIIYCNLNWLAALHFYQKRKENELCNEEQYEMVHMHFCNWYENRLSLLRVKDYNFTTNTAPIMGLLE